MSASCKSYIKTAMTAEGFKDTEANDKLASAIAKGVQKYLNANVKANTNSGNLVAL